MRKFVVFVALALAACTPAPAPTPSSGSVGALAELEVRVVAGPVCPVETEEPDPACDPRPVAGALVLVQPGDGRDIVVARGTTDGAGVVRLELPAGDYIVVGAEVEGLFGLPEPMPIVVNGSGIATVTLVYDTGIR